MDTNNLNYKDLFKQLGNVLWKLTIVNWKLLVLTSIKIYRFIVMCVNFLVNKVQNYPQIALLLIIVLPAILAAAFYIERVSHDKSMDYVKFNYQKKLDYEHHVNEINLESITNLHRRVAELETELKAKDAPKKIAVKPIKVDSTKVITE